MKGLLEHKTVYFIEPLFHRSYCAHRIQRSCHQSDDDEISPPDLILMETYCFSVFLLLDVGIDFSFCFLMRPFSELLIYTDIIIYMYIYIYTGGLLKPCFTVGK